GGDPVVRGRLCHGLTVSWVPVNLLRIVAEILRVCWERRAQPWRWLLAAFSQRRLSPFRARRGSVLETTKGARHDDPGDRQRDSRKPHPPDGDRSPGRQPAGR